MPVTISDEVLAAAHISASEVKQELALTFFQQDRLTLAQASCLAEMSQLTLSIVAGGATNSNPLRRRGIP